MKSTNFTMKKGRWLMLSIVMTVLYAIPANLNAQVTIESLVWDDICFGTNPNSGYMEVVWSGGEPPYLVAVDNGDGPSVVQYPDEPGGTTYSFSWSNLPAGTYTFSLTDGSTPPYEVTQEFTIMQLDKLSFGGISYGDYCDPGTGHFYATWSGGRDLYQATLYFGPEDDSYSYPASSSTNLSVGNLYPDTYTLVVEDDCGDEISFQFDILPSLTANAGEDVTVIIDDAGTNSCTMLKGDASGGSQPYSYVWYEGTTVIGTTQNVKVCPDVPGSTTVYTLEVTDANDCTSTDEIEVSVEHMDDITFQYCDDEMHKAYICHLQGNGKYKKLCVDLHAIPAHMNHGDMIYDGTTNNCNGPGTKSTPVDEELHGHTSLSAYPNPFSGSATVSFATENAGNIEVRLLDLTGKLVRVLYNGSSDAGQNQEVVIHAGDLQPGIYFCLLQDETGVLRTEKLVLTQ